MGEPAIAIAPASFQQIDLLRQLSEAPTCAEQYDGVMVFQLDGRVNVSALSGAIGELVERHPALRTTMTTDGTASRQEVHAGRVVPVTISRPDAASVAAVAHEMRAARLSAADAASGAPLFRAGIVALDNTHLLTLKVHHLITDGWSDAVMLRDLSELYRARVEKRSPDLPVLSWTYADFARQQHADWPALKPRVVAHWATQLDGYPGYVVWPRPAETLGDPYECKTITRILAAQASIGVRLAARVCQVPPFLVLIAATVTAIGDVTGQYDLLVGSNVANREALGKRDLIGYFTNTRLMRVHLTPDRSARAATAIVREQWLWGDDFRDAYIDQVLAAIGFPRTLKIDAFDLPTSLIRVGLDLPDVVVSAPPRRHSQIRHWRDLNVTWTPYQGGFRLEVRHRLAAVDQETATAIAERAIALLAQLTREEARA